MNNIATTALRIGRRLGEVLSCCRGQTLVEYALLIALLSIAIVGVSSLVAGESGVINDIGEAFNAAVDSALAD